MKDLSEVSHHPTIEAIVDTLCNKTQNTDRGFFRVVAAYFLAKMAASMRATVQTKDRGEIPVNVYALALATSGFGKGHSVHLLESDFLGAFKTRFMEETFPVIAEEHLWKRAIEAAAISGNTEDDEKTKLDKEFRRLGAYAFTFDSGSSPAVKQMREKLLLANIGAINAQIDEIGSNLIGSTELLTLFLELYDQGIVKQKLTKNTADNMRTEDLDGKTPTNALLFGTPAKLLDGGQTEDHFFSFLETGYARRCLFAWGEYQRGTETLTPAEVYARLIQPQNTAQINTWSTHFRLLADPAKFNWKMQVDDTVAIELLAYRMDCERKAAEMSESQGIRKAEMSHRYFKVLKLAGTLAFVDESAEVTMDHLHAAMKLVEESGLAFEKMLNREKPYVKLARYIAEQNTALTHADLHEALPFYKAGNQARNELMSLAMAWGYKQHILITKTFDSGIEFFKGETLEETSLDRIKIAYSDHVAYNYQAENAPFDQLHRLTQAKGLHWTNHGFKNGHRADENVIPGFNAIVLDVDGGVSLSMAHEFMKEYTFLTYTTKRHTDAENRFRLIMPMNYVLELDQADYRAFMNSVMDSLPFKNLDEAANQRAKKWESYDGGSYHYNEGQLFDCLPFIPKTSKNEIHQQEMQKLGDLDGFERWFAQRMGPEGSGRNNLMIKFALGLVDTGMSYTEVEQAVLSFNGKLAHPIGHDELMNTILVTVARKVHAPAA